MLETVPFGTSNLKIFLQNLHATTPVSQIFTFCFVRLTKTPQSCFVHEAKIKDRGYVCANA